MSAFQFGPSPIGVSGYVTHPNIPSGGFRIVVLAGKRSSDLGLRPRFGRGTNGDVSYRPTVLTGDLGLAGQTVFSAKPEPGDWTGQTVPLTLTYGENRTITYQIIVNKFSSERAAKSDTLWNFELSARILGRPVYSAAWGNSVSSGDLVKSDVRQYEGTSIGYDRNGLAPPLTVVLWDWWGLTADTDAALFTRLKTFLENTPPPYPELKRRPGTIAQDAPDGGTVQLTYGLTDTAEDVLLPRNTYTNDPKNLQSISHGAALNSQASIPLGATATVIRTHSSVKLNDGNTLNEVDGGLLTTQEDREFPNTWVNPDPSDLRSTWAQLSVFPFGSTVPVAIVPAGQRLRTSQIVRINQLESAVVYTGAKDSTKEEWEQTHSSLVNDPFGLQSTAEVAQVDVPPSQTLTGFTFRKMRIEEITHDHNGYIAEFGQRSTISDIEYPGSPKSTDIEHIDDEAKLTRVTQNLNPGPPPAVPIGADGVPLGQLVETDTVRQDDGNYVHSWKYANTTSFQKIAFPQAKFNVDPADIEYHEEIPVRSASFLAPMQPTPQNAALKFRSRRGFRISGTPEQWLHIFEFDHNTTQDDIELKGTNTHNDPNDIDEWAEITKVTSTAFPPAVPAAPLGTFNTVVSQPLTAPNGTYTGRWSHTFQYNSTTNLQKITNKGDIDRDVSDLKSEDMQTQFSLSSNPPPDLAARVPGTKVIRRVSTRRVGTPPGWEHNAYYGFWDEKDRIEAAGTWQKIDPNNIESDSKITLVRATQPADPIPPVGMKIISRESKPLPNGFTEYSFVAANSDSLDKYKLPKFKTGIDPNAIDDSAVRVREWFTNGTAPANPTNPPTNNVKLIGTTDLTLSPAVGASPGTNLRVWLYGAKDSADELTLPKNRTSIDVSGLESSAIRAALDNATPIVDPVLTAANLQYVTTHTQQVTINLPNSNHTLYVFEYALLTPKQQIELKSTIAISSPMNRFKRRTATVVPVTGTAAQMADAIRDAAMVANDRTFERAALELLNNQWARKIIEQTGDDRLIHSGSWHSGLESMRAKPTAGFGLPGCVVHFIAPGPVTGVSFTTGTIVPFEVYRVRGRFLYRRRVLTATPEAYDFQGSIRTVCSLAFLGYPAHTIMYAGAIRQYCYAMGGVSLLVNDYVMQYDSEMWVTFSSCPYGRVFTRAGTGGPPASGYVDPQLFDQFASAEWPSPTQFNVFDFA